MGVTVEGSRIFLIPPGEPRIEIFAESATEFFTKGYKSGLTFVRAASGNVCRLVFHVRPRDVSLEKVGASTAALTTPARARAALGSHSQEWGRIQQEWGDI